MRPFAVFCLLLAAPACAWAGEFQSVSSIRAAALSTLDPAVEGEATVDANLRLPACPVSLQARATGNRAVEVGCPQPGGWKLFVPVAVRNEQSVLMLARGVAAGETLGPADITTVRRDTARMAGAVLSDPQLAVGRVARRALGAGTVLGAGDPGIIYPGHLHLAVGHGIGDLGMSRCGQLPLGAFDRHRLGRQLDGHAGGQLDFAFSYPGHDIFSAMGLLTRFRTGARRQH